MARCGVVLRRWRWISCRCYDMCGVVVVGLGLRPHGFQLLERPSLIVFTNQRIRRT